MQDGTRIDWRAIPARYRAWQALPAWRKALWAVSRSVLMVVLYALFAVGILWYNEPALVEGVGAGRESLTDLVWAVASQPELLAILLILVPAVVAAVLLPTKPAWMR
jgi:hypothetical protein